MGRGHSCGRARVAPLQGAAGRVVADRGGRGADPVVARHGGREFNRPRRDAGWAWRIPFVGSGLLIAIGWLLRRKVDETPEFTSARQQGRCLKYPIGNVFKDHAGALLSVAGARVAEISFFYIVTAFTLWYATRQLGLPEAWCLNGVTLGAAAATFLMPLCGMLGDRWGARRIYIAGIVTALLWILPFFMLVNTPRWCGWCLPRRSVWSCLFPWRPNRPVSSSSSFRWWRDIPAHRLPSTLPGHWRAGADRCHHAARQNAGGGDLDCGLRGRPGGHFDRQRFTAQNASDAAEQWVSITGGSITARPVSGLCASGWCAARGGGLSSPRGHRERMKDISLPDFYQITPEPVGSPHFETFFAELTDTLRSGIRFCSFAPSSWGRANTWMSREGRWICAASPGRF